MVKMAAKFVHLHSHTEYSLLDGLSRINKLIAHIKDCGMDAIAITDHGSMYGAIEFYKGAKKEGIKPIIGMEAYTVSGDLNEKTEKTKSKNFHLILLAKNNEGYKNLMKLTSIAHIEGYYYKPRFDHKTLEKYSNGLICTSSCPQGEIGQALINDDYENAKAIAEWYNEVFNDDYYLEIQRHGFDKVIPDIKDVQLRSSIQILSENEQKYVNGSIKLSRDLGIPLIATNDAHYIKKEDAEAQDALICIATGKNVSDIKRLRYIDNPDFYVKTPDEMVELFRDYPDAIENTLRVSAKCDLEITLGKWFFPKFPLPDDLSPGEHLKKMSIDKLKVVIPDYGTTEEERLNYELEVICSKGFAPYFLIVTDMVNWANSKGIITNTRGSVAGSLVSYVLGITTVNPITYYLPFERFLNPSRPSPPDIDFDVSDNRRDEVIAYIGDKYGHDKVAQVCTFGRMLSRAAVRDVARVLGFPYSIGDRVSKLIPPPKQGFPITIPKAMEEVPELAELYEKDPDTKKILDLAMQIEGNARHLSVHAAAVVVAPSDIRDFTPVQLEPSGEKIITQYEMHASEDVGLIKFDILGIRNLSILASAIEIVKNKRGIEIDIKNIPLDDKKTFGMLSRGETMGTFQLGGGGLTKYLKELKPERIEDLMAMVALYRPGPISQIPEYIKRKNNPKLVKYLDPRMEKFLDMSYGLIVYQDDLLFCALDLAGYSWEEADKFRKAVGKKIPEEMAAQKEKFIKGIIDNGQTSKFAEELWKLFEPFQAYGFNKAHAASYGIVAYQTSYMKANYPVEYMCALLTAESNDTEKIASAVGECKRMGIKVLPPDINESLIGFNIEEDKDSLEGKSIRFGFNAIKNVGKAAIDSILEARNKEKFLSLSDFLSKVDSRKVNKKVLDSLIKVGALSTFGNRAAILGSIDSIKNKISRSKSPNNQEGLFSQEEVNKASVSDNNIDFTNVEEFTDEEIQNLERQLLGFSLSAKPISELIEELIPMTTHKIQDLFQSESIMGSVKIAGVIDEIRTIVTKKSGQEMAFIKLRDDTGMIGLVVFPKTFQNSKSLLIGNKALLISGKIDIRGDDEPSLIVDDISENSAGLNSKSEKLFLRIPKEAGEYELKMLRGILVSHPGNQTVILIFDGGKNITLPFKVSWDSELAQNISQIFHNLKNMD